MHIFSPKEKSEPTIKKRRSFPWKLLFKLFVGFFLFGLLSAIGVFAYFAKDLPNPGKVNTRFIPESTKIFDRTGEHLLYEVHGEEKRTQIPFSEIPDTIKYATISLEDQDFYNHHGIKLTSIFRSIFKDIITFQKAQGGSTITQQFVKNSLLTNEKSLVRKIKEVILSLELETKFSKDEILTMYLNEIPYGSNAYGIEAASQTFFGKPARELSLDEAALIASLPQATTYYSPYGSHTDALIGRKMFTLKTMARLGYITQEQADEAINTETLKKIQPQKNIFAAPHFVMYIKDYLQQKYGDSSVEQGGLRVYTTLDWDKQQLAEKVVEEGAEKNSKTYKAGNAGLVAMDPKTGQILAMVGSKDYFAKSEPEGCTPGKTCTFEPNVNVAVSLLQPGSSFKPYVYLTAFMKGYTPETNIWDVDTNFSTEDGKEYDPKNYDGKNAGLMQMKDALARSLNTPAVKTLYLVGTKEAVKIAKSMGITTLNEPDRYGLSLVLGGGEVKLLDHVNAYSTFATGGIRHDKTAILRIEDNKGNILEKYTSSEGERVIEEKYVAMIDYVMSTNSLRAPVFGDKNDLSFENRPVAAKTGTTNEWRDGWTMGYTPSLVAGVWVGNNDHSIMKPGADGILVASPIWRAFMNEALKNSPIEQFPKYEPEETEKDILDGKLEMKKEVKVCEIPGEDDEYCLANDACPENKMKKKKFADAHSILYYIDKNNVRGDAPKNPKDDPQFENWEKAIKNWLKENDYSTKSAPDKECEEKDFSRYKIEVKIKSPSDGEYIKSKSFTISTDISAPYGVKKATISVDGQDIKSSDDDSFSATYDIPEDKYQSELEIKLKATDESDNSDSKTINVKTNIQP